MANRLTLSRARGLFVTGTDTGVGKTVVTGALARCMREKGWRVGVLKPVATGCRRRREELVSMDAEFLAHCSETEQPLARINPIRYVEPVAPLVAVERSGRKIDWQELARTYRQVAQDHEVLLVEGIGGVMVPLEADYLVLDLMAAAALPVLIVVRSRLGAINHTLLTVELCRSRGLYVCGVVINGYRADEASLAEETNARVIAEAGRVKVLTVIPFEPANCIGRGQLGPETLAAMRLVDWPSVIDQGCRAARGG